MKCIKKWKLNYMELALGILFAVQIIMVMYCNLTLIESNLDTDNAKLFTHIIEMWKHKKLAVPNWSYTTTLEWDCTTIFALPIYGLTKNIYLACGLSNIMLFTLFMASIFYLFRGKMLLYPLLCSNLLAVPYHLGMLEYFNMMFFCGTQYVVKVTIPLILVGIFLSMEKKQTKRQLGITVFFIVLYLFFLVISSISSSIYVAVCGLLPVFLAYFGYKLFCLEKIPRITYGIAISTLILVLWGRNMNLKWFGVMRGESMMLSNAYSFIDTIQRCFTGMFELFGGISENRLDVKAFSLQGVLSIEKICLVLLMLICGGTAIKKIVRKQADLRTFLLLFLFFWNVLILSVTVTRAGSNVFEHRYHLIGMLPLVCVTGITLIDGFQKLDWKRQKRLFLVGYFALVFLCGQSYVEVLDQGDLRADLKELVQYCEKFDVDYVYLYKESDNSGICRFLGGNARYFCLLDDGYVWAYDYYSYYFGCFMQTTNVIVAIDDEQNNLGEEQTIAGHRLVQFDRIGNRNLYYFEN